MEKLPEFIINNMFWITLWVAILMLLLWNMFSETLMGISQLEPQAMTRAINHDKAVVVDIRSAEDYAAGHILNALNLPVTELSERLKELERYRDRQIIVYCQHGVTTTQAIRQMKVAGYTNVAALKGGLMAWLKAAMPVTTQTNQRS